MERPCCRALLEREGLRRTISAVALYRGSDKLPPLGEPKSRERCGLGAVQRHLLVVLLASIAAGVAATPAAGKEDVEATLDTQIPLNPSPGEQLWVAWTLTYIDEQGKRQPFGAGGVFIRLFSASDGKATTGVASGDGGRTGEFDATVVVPEGGIGKIAIGLHGIASGPTGSWTSDVYFPVKNSPFPVVAKSAPVPPESASAPSASATSAPSSESGDGRLATWIGVLALVFSLMLGSLGVLVWRRRHATNRAHPKLL
jgi:hypothetical protein